MPARPPMTPSDADPDRLPDAWRGADAFTVLDLDFGCGAGFLAAWRAWRADPARCGRLRYAALLEHPVPADVLRARLAALMPGPPSDGALADAMLARWPPAMGGVFRAGFDAHHVQLTVAVGAARTMLPGWLSHADALRVPVAADRVHDAPVLRAAAALLVARGTATIATRAGERASAMLIARRDGYAHALAGAGLHPVPADDAPLAPGSMRALRAHRLHGPSAIAGAVPERRALVVGAGLAGCAIGDALARRGWSVVRIDAGDVGAAIGSLQPVLAQHPSVTPDDAPMSRLARAATLLAHGAFDEVRALRRHGRVQQVAPAAVDAIAARWPRDWVEPLDAAGASERAGVALRGGGLWLPWASSADPARLRDAWTSASVDARSAVEVALLERRDGHWHALDAHGATIACAPVAIVATGGADASLRVTPSGTVHRLHSLLGDAGLRRRAGRTTIATLPAARMPRCIVGGDGHAVPIDAGRLLLGPAGTDTEERATRIAVDASSTVDDPSSERAWRRYAAQLLTPGPLPPLSPGHAGVRLSTRDHLPIAGAVPDLDRLSAARPADRRDDRAALPTLPGLWAACALGGRGLLWSVLAAEVIASALEGEPAPIERALGDAIAPDRFLRRALRRDHTPG